ncbi:MAG: hypothetical protein R3C53_11250 [Pirellulaceae bacterium]
MRRRAYCARQRKRTGRAPQCCTGPFTRIGRDIAIPIYIDYLRNENNGLVNLAAEALGQLAGEESVLPLIEPLVTKHKQKEGGGKALTAPLARFAGKEKVRIIDVENRSVFGTLTQLTGQSLGYDQVNGGRGTGRHAAPAFDLHRDR